MYNLYTHIHIFVYLSVDLTSLCFLVVLILGLYWIVRQTRNLNGKPNVLYIDFGVMSGSFRIIMSDIAAWAPTDWDDVMCSCVTPIGFCYTIRLRRPLLLGVTKKSGNYWFNCQLPYSNVSITDKLLRFLS